MGSGADLEGTALASFINRLQGLLSGAESRAFPLNSFGGLLSPEAAQEAQRQSKLAAAGGLLGASVGQPVPTNPMANLANALQLGNQVQQQVPLQELQQRLIQSQLGLNQARTVAALQPGQGRAETADLRNARALSDKSIPQEVRDQLRRQLTPGNENLNVPISIAGLNSLVDSEGNHPPPGTTFAEAAQLGYKTANAAEQTRGTAGRSATGILDQMEELAFGEDGVFIGSQPGLTNRAFETAQTGLDLLTQENPNVSRYHDMSRATVAPLIRYLGEVGALAEGDVQRALGLQPRLFPMKDTEEVAKNKFIALRQILGAVPSERFEEFNELPDGQKNRLRELTNSFFEQAEDIASDAGNMVSEVASDAFKSAASIAELSKEQFTDFFQGKSVEEIDEFLVSLPPDARAAIEKRADELQL